MSLYAIDNLTAVVLYSVLQSGSTPMDIALSSGNDSLVLAFLEET